MTPKARSRMTRTIVKLVCVALSSATTAVALGAVSSSPAVAAGSFDGLPTEIGAVGANNVGQRNVPAALTDYTSVVKDISAGYDHTVAVTGLGKLIAWGDDSSGEGHVPAALQQETFKAVSAGLDYSLAVTTGGAVRAWGSSARGLTTIPPDVSSRSITAVSAGNSFALALDAAGKVHAWGDNNLGQLAIPAVLDGLRVVKISAGSAFALAVTEDNQVIAWGDNTYGPVSVPAALQGRTIDEIDAGYRHAVALLDDGTLMTWGDNSSGQLTVPVVGETSDRRWQHVSAGDGYTIGVNGASSYLAVWGKGATTTFADRPYSSFGQARLSAGGAFAVYGYAWLMPGAQSRIEGTGRVGEPLTGILGTFKPLDATATHGGWRLAGGPYLAEGQTYTPTADQVGQRLVFDTIGQRAGYQLKSNNDMITVLPGVFETPSAPTISGTARVGQVLTASVSFSPTPDRLHYDWFVDGVFKQATADGRYTIKPEDLYRTIKVSVAAFKAGYTTAFSGFSESTPAVSPAPALTITSRPTIPLRARVGQQVTATPPASDPSATTVTYQWLRGTNEIAGATGRSYTPTAADRGTYISVYSVLSRDGYAPTRTDSDTAAYVDPGQFTDVSAPTVTGSPVVGSTLHATVSSSPAAESVVYAWYAGDTLRLSGPADYQVSAADLGLRITARAVLSRTAYESATSPASSATAPVTARQPDPLPTIRVTSPARISGAAVAGTLLAATDPTTDVPGTAAYQWFRSGQAVAGASGQTYRLGAADVGQALSVTVTVRRAGYTSAVSTSTPTGAVAKASPRLKGRARVRGGRTVLKVTASAAGLPALSGKVTVLVGQTLRKRATISGGRLTVSLPLTRGPLRITLAATAATVAATVTVRAR